MTLAVVVQHLQVFEESGVIRTQKVGRVRTCRLEPDGLRAAEQWLEERRTLWERRFDRLGELLGWFAEGEGWEVLAFDMDFRVGGLEHSRFRFKDGPEIRNDTVFQDIVPNQRIVIAYTMAMGDGARCSASLATMEFMPAEGGTRLVFTEQGAYFDGADAPKNREAGTRQLLESLAEELARSQ